MLQNDASPFFLLSPLFVSRKRAAYGAYFFTPPV